MYASLTYSIMSSDSLLERRKVIRPPLSTTPYRERGPRSGPREPLTSAREGTLEVFSFRKGPKNLA